MSKIFEALCQLLAPILVFTSEEAWSYLDTGDSVHLQLFPQIDQALHNPAVQNQVSGLLKLRAVIGQAIEHARLEKLVGNSLEAAVTLQCNTKVISAIPKDELEEFFILSDLKLQSGIELSAIVSKTVYQKCARCWRHRQTVGTSAAHPDLCDRCESVITSMKLTP